MAAKKKKSGKKATSKAKAAAKPRAATGRKKIVKKVVKEAKGLLGKIAQRSAQLILDTGLLGEEPKRSSKRAPAKKRQRKA